VAQLALPSSLRKIWRKISSSPHDTPATCLSAPFNSRRGWNSGLANDIIVLECRGDIGIAADHAGDLLGTRMVVSKASLLRVLSLSTQTGGTTTRIPWKGWSCATRLFLGVCSPVSVPAGSRLGLLVRAYRQLSSGIWHSRVSGNWHHHPHPHFDHNVNDHTIGVDRIKENIPNFGKPLLCAPKKERQRSTQGSITLSTLKPSQSGTQREGGRTAPSHDDWL
jgi:hypothetical protein